MAKYDPDEFLSAERKAKPFGDGISCCPVCGVPKSIGKPTNADRIRAMPDEELAERFASACPPKDVTNRCCQYYLQGSNGCKDCWLDWLKEESK